MEDQIKCSSQEAYNSKCKCITYRKPFQFYLITSIYLPLIEISWQCFLIVCFLVPRRGTLLVKNQVFAQTFKEFSPHNVK